MNKIITRRNTLTALSSAGALAVWHKPIVTAVITPAHAQTSISSSIMVESLDADNPFSRYILIVDDADNVVANCGASGGTASVTGLAPGTYRVFGDSDGPQSHQVSVTTDRMTRTFSVPTDTGTCNYLMATVELPSGIVSIASGSSVSGSWTCFTNLGDNCL